MSTNNNFVNCDVYKINNNKLINIKYHVFISKQATWELTNFVYRENWGKDNSRMYNYLDYIWRLQLIDKMVKIFKYNNESRVVFHTGLKSRNNNEPVYLVLEPNNLFCNGFIRVTQDWRVSCNKGTGINKSFVTRQDLIRIYRIKPRDIPVKTNLYYKRKFCQFNPEYKFVMNLKQRVHGIFNRVKIALENDIGFKGELSESELKNKLKYEIIKTVNYARDEPRIATQQVFINKDSSLYHLELLLPLILNINGKDVYFALVCRVNNNLKCYEGMSIITRDIAFTNSRLVGKVNVSWLKPFTSNNTINKNDISTRKILKISNKYKFNTHNIFFEGQPLNNISNINNITKNNINININVTNNISYNGNNNSDTNMLNKENNLNLNYCDGFSMNYTENPFIYLATVLPLKLPNLNCDNKGKHKSCELSLSYDLSCNESVSNSLESSITFQSI